MFDLTGKTALVTGASGGIGSDIARALHKQGATVALSGTRKDALDALAAELGARTLVLPCNLSDSAAVDALPKQAEEAIRARSEKQEIATAEAELAAISAQLQAIQKLRKSRR